MSRTCQKTKTCFHRNNIVESDIACLECLLSDHMEDVDERGTLEIDEVTDNELDGK